MNDCASSIADKNISRLGNNKAKTGDEEKGFCADSRQQLLQRAETIAQEILLPAPVCSSPDSHVYQDFVSSGHICIDESLRRDVLEYIKILCETPIGRKLIEELTHIGKPLDIKFGEEYRASTGHDRKSAVVRLKGTHMTAQPF